jgi:hypothetical protein
MVCKPSDKRVRCKKYGGTKRLRRLQDCPCTVEKGKYNRRAEILLTILELQLWPVDAVFPEVPFPKDFANLTNCRSLHGQPAKSVAEIECRQEYSSAWHYWTSRSRPLQMLDVLDYLLRSFNRSTDWNDDNLYSNLTLTSRCTCLALRILTTRPA